MNRISNITQINRIYYLLLEINNHYNIYNYCQEGFHVNLINNSLF